MKFKFILYILGLYIVFNMTACESVDSDDVRTSGVYADIDVEARGDGITRVRARLTVGGVFSNTDLELEQGDQLIASASGGTSVIMREDKEFLGGVEYKAAFQFDVENTRINIALNRPAGVSAPSSYVNLPASVSFVTPVAGQTFKRSDYIQISWTPVSNNMSDMSVYSSRARCVDANGQEISNSGNSNSLNMMVDPGSITQAARSYIVASALADPAATCVVTLTISRKQNGVIDPAFGEGGTIKAVRYDTVEVNIVP